MNRTIALDLAPDVESGRRSHAASWNVVLARDGTVLATSQDAPQSWLGTILTDCADASEGVKQAAQAVLSRASESSLPTTRTFNLDSTPSPLHLTVIEALPLRRTGVDVRSLLPCALDVLRRQARDRDVAFDIIVEDSVPRLIKVDSEKVAWAVSALVGNALRYVRPGSRMMPGGSVRIVVSCEMSCSELSIEVQDNGPGIAADRLPRLFDGAPDGSRAALGLLIVRDIATAHGGRLDITSDTTPFAGGTTIRLTLPVS